MRKMILAVMLLAVAVPVFAQEGGAGAPRPTEVVTRFLQLSADQVNQWNVLLATREATVEPLQQQIRGAERQLAELLKGESPDPAAVGQLVIDVKELREQIGVAHQAYVQGFEALLTPEQKERLEFVRKAARVEPILPAFRVVGLLPPPLQRP